MRVVAVEPNEPMIEVGRARGGANIQWRLGTAESSGLDDQSVDLVLCAQAFHWVDAPRALTEFRRVLRQRTPSGVPGRCAVVWNVHDESDGFTRAYREVIVRHATEPPTSPSFTGHERTPRFEAPQWGGARLETHEHEQVLVEAALIGRAVSSSYCPSAGPAYERLVAELRDLHSRWERDGLVRLKYQTRVHLAERAV